MASHYIITIARTFGSGGKAAGLELSKRLGIPCYENEILDMASEASGVNRAFFYENDLKAKHVFFRSMVRHTPREILKTVPTDRDFTSDKGLFGHQAELIRYLAVSQSCIIIGKCADYILGSGRNIYRFFVDTAEESAIREVEKRLGVDPKEAKRLISKTNKYRSDYYKYYTGKAWKDLSNYDLMINSSGIGIHNLPDLMEEVLRLRNKGELPIP